MNGDTVEHIVRFLEREEDSLPAKVTNGMVLIAIREVRDDVKSIKKVLYGQETDGKDGLIYRMEKFETFKALILWAVSPIVLAFLGGLGAFLFGLVSR